MAEKNSKVGKKHKSVDLRNSVNPKQDKLKGIHTNTL